MDFRREVIEGMEYNMRMVIEPYGLAILLFGIYGFGSRFLKKPLYKSSQPIKLKPITDLKKYRLVNNLAICAGVGYLVWSFFQYRQDLSVQILMFYNLVFYGSMLTLMTVLFNSGQMMIYKDCFRVGLRIYQGYDLSMFFLNEETATISFKHINNQYQFTTPPNVLREHYAFLLRCAGKQLDQ
jgi:hypothetical protein